MRLLHLFNDLSDNGGFTARHEGALEFTAYQGKGYAVSLPGWEIRFPTRLIENSFNLFGQAVTALTNYAITSDNQYIGGWVDGDLTYLDVSIVVDTLDEALALGQEYNQLSVFSFGTFESIPVTPVKEEA